LHQPLLLGWWGDFRLRLRAASDWFSYSLPCAALSCAARSMVAAAWSLDGGGHHHFFFMAMFYRLHTMAAVMSS